MDRHSVQILVVDDEGPIRRLLRKFLEEAGYATRMAESVAAAREELNTVQFDLVLCDLDMPGESGLELLRYLKTSCPDTGRVMVTGTSDPEIASEILEIGVYGYILKPFNRSILLITVQNALQHLRLDRDMRTNKRILEDEMWRRTEKLSTILDNLQIGVTMVDPDLRLVEMNRRMREWFPAIELSMGKKCYHNLNFLDCDRPCENCPMAATLARGEQAEITHQLLTGQGKRDFHVVTTPIYDKERNIVGGIGLYEDITEKNMIEQELRQAQKIEAIGQLAAGITHEINTPIQYVGDNLSFLQQSFGDIFRVLTAYHQLFTVVQAGEVVPADKKQAVMAAIDDADLEYLLEEIPKTLAQGLEGVGRVAKIVRAMKEFSHPGSDEKTFINLNELLESTLTISRNQWKYVAKLETDLQPDLPLVACLPGEINQVFLNLIVNAAHAIGDLSREGQGGLGTITITTRQVGKAVQVRISDTGGGIPEPIKERIFEPFFTTKPRGKGTGQGLAISRRVVVDKHQGLLSFQTEPGKGTTFIIDLPL
jgi:two-component system NtrC family sensor kinase